MDNIKEIMAKAMATPLDQIANNIKKDQVTPPRSRGHH
jgi:hypothetical protein